MALAGALVFGPVWSAAAAPSEPAGPPVLSLADLQDALDRGDLSQWEFDLLAELVGNRERIDSAESARLAKLVERPGIGSGELRGTPRGSLEYGVYAPLRGSGRSGEELRVLPAFRGASATIQVRREQSLPWVVTEASAEWRRGAVLLQAGSLHPLWTGGLLVGRSPVFVGESVPGLAGLWQPGRARLRGALARIALTRLESEVFGSSIVGARWQHRAAGARIRAIAGPVWIEPALLAQHLGRMPSDLLYQSLVWGLSGGLEVGNTTLQLQSAVTSGAPAFQAHVSGKRSAARWQVEYWRVSPAFRNPLLHARGEIDREFVYYPELDTSLASASTGESGGSVALRSGGARVFGEVGATVWREHPSRPAAVRLEAATQASGQRRMVRLEFLHLKRPGQVEFNRRHEVALKARRGGVFGELRGKWTQLTYTSPLRVGGRLAAGIDVKTAHVGLWEAGVAWDAYDLSLASGQFVTLRVHHSLPLGHCELAWHLRWRSAYATYPAALSLRLNSSVYL